MIDYLDDFVDSDIKETLVGGIAGTEINKYAIDAAMKHHAFNKVLVIEGCQDYIGLMPKPLANVKHWSDLFVEQVVDPLVPFDPWKARVEQPQSRPLYINRLDTNLLSQYEMIVVYDSHLLPYDIRESISQSFSGQIIWVYDPGEPHIYMGHIMPSNIPVVVDTLRKLSPILAMARDALGFDTRAVESKIKGSVVETGRINKRSIGKIDDKQYVTNDWGLHDEIVHKQYESPFRKNQKVIVCETVVDMMNENGVRKASLGRNSMLVIDNANANPLMKLRLYNSKTTYYADLAYNYGEAIPLKRRNQISVAPANILIIDDVQYHRYNHTVLILEHPLSKRDRYSVLKNSNNLTVISKFKT